MLLLRIRRVQNLFAGGRKLRQRWSGPRRWRLFRRLRVEDRILKPVGELAFAAAFAAPLVRLSLAFAAAGRASHANVEVIIVAVPRAYLGKPAAVALGFAAQRLLDRGVDEDALHARFLRGVAHKEDMARREGFRINV